MKIKLFKCSKYLYDEFTAVVTTGDLMFPNFKNGFKNALKKIMSKTGLDSRKT